MNRITVTASKKYDIIVGFGLHAQVGAYAKTVSRASKVAIISDSTVWPLYGKTVNDSLLNAGFSCCHYIFQAGEASKSGQTYLDILNFLAENHLTRSDLLVALGGGVVGDITGFAAATYLRGISCIQIPTTLLSMVDSSVGGKTAIDLPAGKNLAGAFYQPDLVLCDIEALKTLPQEIFRDGCAEVIKYGILYDPDLFAHLENNGLDFDRESVITRCIALKRDVVAEDEFDTGMRQKLNLGHTIGHAIEGSSNYTLAHGEAVAIGMAIISRSAASFHICDETVCTQIVSVLKQFGLSTTTEYSSEVLTQIALSDKKRAGCVINLIVPLKIGNCIIRPTPVTELKSFIEAGL